MATKISAIYTLITADDKPLKRGLVKARGEAVKGAARIQKALNKINFKAIGLGVVAMAGTMAYASKKFIDLAVEQERVEKRLGAVIKSTGEAAGYTLDELKKMASAMQSVTTTGDEAILSGMAVLATFKQVRGSAFERTTMAALDLAEVVGQDLNSAMIQLGKALNDPVANLGALSRAGIQFTKQQKELIKGLWEAGKTAEAQGLILDELESQFGGTAKAARDTFGGALQSLKNTLGDIGETIGFALMPPIKKMIDSFARWIEINDKLLNQDIPGFITRIGKAAASTAKFLYRMNQALNIALGTELENSVLEAHLKQLKEVEKKYADQQKRLEAVGWTGGAAYERIGRELDLVRQKIKLVEAEVAQFLRKKYFGEKDVVPMDAHVKAYRAALDAADLATTAAKKHEAQITKINQAYINLLPTIKTYSDSWEIKDVRTATDNQLEKAEQLRNEADSLLSKGINEKLIEAFKGVEVTAEDAFNTMLELSERTAWSMQENFSNVFFDAMKGELKSFKDYATAVLDSILRAIADVSAQMVTQGLFGELGKSTSGGGWLSKIFGGASMKAAPVSSNVSTIRGGEGGGYGFQHGGYIGEPVKGFGTASGKSYEFHPNEFVTPANQMGGGVKIDINVVNNLGQEADVKKSTTWVSPDQMVAEIVLNKKLTSRGFRQSMRA